jgi:hypothetical protein
VGNRQEAMAGRSVHDRCLGKGCQETGFHVCSSEDQDAQEDPEDHLARAHLASQQ